MPHADALTSTELTLQCGATPVAALLDTPPDPSFVFVLAHGAGAGMRHAFLQKTASLLGARGVATLRYQFPYMQAGGNRVDPPEVTTVAVNAAVARAAALLPGVPILAGGKSFGGRMTSEAQSRAPLPGVRGLAFLGFPLHPPGRPGVTRAAHLAAVAIPMLFLQGTRDEFADLRLLQGVIEALGGRARLELMDDANHGFAVRQSSGRTTSEVHEFLCDMLVRWGTAQVR